MEKFYVIKVISKNGTKGFIGGANGDIVVYSEFTGQCQLFESHEQAKIFIKEKRIETKGATCVIYSNEELLDTNQAGMAKPISKTLYYIENISGQKIIYDNLRQEYKVSFADAGFCVWETIEQANEFINSIEGDFFVREIKK